MRRMLRVYRVSGDTLSCWFSPEGALSTAVLTVDNRDRQVAGQLPGCKEESALEYLGELGYRERFDQLSVATARALNRVLVPQRLFVECVLRSSDGFLISVVRETERRLVCPERLFVVLYLLEGDRLKCVDVRDEESARFFIEKVRVQDDVTV